MKRDDQVRLCHMRDAAREVMGYCAGMDQAQFGADTRTQRAVTQCVQIIGEAAYHVSQAGRDAYPHVPWASIVGTRHRLVHAYFNTDVNILWQVVQQQLPQLAEILDAVPDPTDP